MAFAFPTKPRNAAPPQAERYCSDSRGEWHYGEPADHIAVRTGRALQLLTHPIWWVGEAAEPELRLRRYLDQRVRALDEDLAANCSVHVTGQAYK